MAVSKTSGTRFFIGPDVNPDTIRAMSDSNAVDFFEAIDSGDWVEVEEIESFGELGDNTEVATFSNVKDRRVRKFKTTRDAGTMAIVVGRDPLDPGQIAMEDAEKTDLNYAFKIIYADRRDEDHTDSVEYFGGVVLSRPVNLGGNQDITKRTFNLAVNSAIYVVASESSIAPTILELPSIIGASVQVGVELEVLEGTWTGSPTSFLYQWKHDVSGNGTFSNVSAGGTSKLYTPVVGDIGDALQCEVRAVNSAGTSSIAKTVAVGPILAA